MRVFARRFTVQERVGEQIADTLDELIEPHGVAVHLEALTCARRCAASARPVADVTRSGEGNYERDPEIGFEGFLTVAQRSLE